MTLEISTDNKRERWNVIIPVMWDRNRGTYSIEIAEPLFAEMQKALIDGFSKDNIGVFFQVEEKRPTANESMSAAIEKAKSIIEKEKEVTSAE